MNINESIGDWVSHRMPDFESLTGMQILTMGEIEDVSPPVLKIEETDASEVETAGVIMRGVSQFEITCELHTVPAETDEGGTPTNTDREMRRDLYDILGDTDGMQRFCEGRNGWRLFDIRLPSPTSSAEEGRRVSTWRMTVIACPI